MRIIYDAADRYDQSRSDMLRVAECESNLDPYAVNPSGSYGLFQFIRSTWESTPYGTRTSSTPKQTPTRPPGCGPKAARASGCVSRRVGVVSEVEESMRRDEDAASRLTRRGDILLPVTSLLKAASLCAPRYHADSGRCSFRLPAVYRALASAASAA